MAGTFQEVVLFILRPDDKHSRDVFWNHAVCTTSCLSGLCTYCGTSKRRPQHVRYLAYHKALPSVVYRASTCSSDAHYVCHPGVHSDAHCRVLFMLYVSTHGRRYWRSIKPFSSSATSARKNKAKAPETFAALSLALGPTLFVVAQDRSLCHTTLLDMPAFDSSENNSCACTGMFSLHDCISVYRVYSLHIADVQCVVREQCVFSQCFTSHV